MVNVNHAENAGIKKKRRLFILSIKELSVFHKDQNYVFCDGCQQTKVLSSRDLPLCYSCTDHPIVLHECIECLDMVDEMELNEEDQCEECDLNRRMI